MLNIFADNFSKKIILVLLFLTITPLTLFSSVISLMALNGKDYSLKAKSGVSLSDARLPKVIAASGKSGMPSYSGQIIAGDARPQVINAYLLDHNSPLAPYSKFLVDTSDKYGLDWRLLVAISQKESGACRVIPEGSHNCWGWGIHSKGTLKFDNYEEAIETVAKGLRENYLDKGYVNPDQIMKKYAHPDSTTWAEGVNMYMQSISD